MATINIFFPTGSLGWFIVNVLWDVFLGVGAFILLVYIMPWIRRPAMNFVIFRDRKGVERSAPMHPKIFTFYFYVAILALIPVLWGIFLTLVFSSGWHNPFVNVNGWFGINAPGWFFDLIYARANNAPDGAHIISWLSCAAFGITVWFKTIKRPLTNFRDVIGDPFQGIAALVFIGGVHELTWVPFYYSAYWEYLSWTILFEVLRDVSFAVMMGLFILAFWKYPDRVIPLRILKPVFVMYLGYLFLWFALPALFGYHPLPVTTVNNTNLGTGLYQETWMFTWWWVNAIESFGWILLCWPSMILVARYKPGRESSVKLFERINTVLSHKGREFTKGDR